MQQKPGIGKWIIGTLTLMGLGISGFFVYRHIKNKNEETKNAQIQVESKRLNEEITKLREVVDHNKKLVEDAKNGKGKDVKANWIHSVNVVSSTQKQNHSSKDLEKLEEEKSNLIEENEKMIKYFNSWCDKNEEIKNKDFERSRGWWELQKNGSWKILVANLESDPVFHRKFDDFITKFFWQFCQEENIPEKITSEELIFMGFGGFKDSEEQSEMGHCSVEPGPTKRNYICHIVINPKCLLNKGNKMDKFFLEEPITKDYRYLGISFDEDTKERGENDLIGTIAHELAHAIQFCKEIERKEEPFSQCWSSGRGKKNNEDILIEPEFPKLTAEHDELQKRFKQKIMTSREYQEFKKWWMS